ncbi:homoprotocatechuate degradation operon regulator HpaR [Duganella sp.]|uniref:homoprotocatechuate degradation operon regulator HpaR n=1 Tax=Duganella sp. TaxID=1904440 RepID=UPI0031E375CA
MAKKIKYRNLPNLLLKARDNVLAQFRPIISHFGLTEQQWRILRVLSDAGDLEQREISESCLILGPSLTGVLSRMEDMKLIARTRMEEDQRRVTVRMTALGEKVVDAMSPLITQQYRNLEQAYGPEMMAEIIALMDRFNSADRNAVAQVKLPGPEQLDPEVAHLLK